MTGCVSSLLGSGSMAELGGGLAFPFSFRTGRKKSRGSVWDLKAAEKTEDFSLEILVLLFSAAEG